MRVLMANWRYAPKSMLWRLSLPSICKTGFKAAKSVAAAATIPRTNAKAGYFVQMILLIHNHPSCGL